MPRPCTCAPVRDRIRIYGVSTFVFTVMREPEFLAVFTGVGEAAYRRADGVLAIPLRALGA